MAMKVADSYLVNTLGDICCPGGACAYAVIGRTILTSTETCRIMQDGCGATGQVAWMTGTPSARTVGLPASASVTTPATCVSGMTANRDAAPIFSELAST